MYMLNSQKNTDINSFSSSNLSSILRLTSSISFLISNTSCDVSQVMTLSCWCMSPSYSTGTCFLWRVKRIYNNIIILKGGPSWYIYRKYTRDGILTISYFLAASTLAIFTKSMPNISASPSISSSSSSISSHSAQSSSSISKALI